MAYEGTSVPVERSQGDIYKLILEHGGTGVAFVSQPPNEGVEAQILIDGATYKMRLTAQVALPSKPVRRRRRWASAVPKNPIDIERKRVWRVLFYHLKSVYEASESGVLEFRELMLPYLVTRDGRTIADHLLPKLNEAIAGRPDRMLPAKGDSHATT